MKAFAVGFALVTASYFNYWQGYYRGADSTLCVVASAMKDKEITARRCPKVNDVYFHWKED